MAQRDAGIREHAGQSWSYETVCCNFARQLSSFMLEHVMSDVPQRLRQQGLGQYAGGKIVRMVHGKVHFTDTRGT